MVCFFEKLTLVYLLIIAGVETKGVGRTENKMVMRGRYGRWGRYINQIKDFPLIPHDSRACCHTTVSHYSSTAYEMLEDKPRKLLGSRPTRVPTGRGCTASARFFLQFFLF